MRVKLLSHTLASDIVVATAAKTCYSNKAVHEIFRELLYPPDSTEEISRIIRKCRDSGHLSVFEHATFTFAIEDVSRALLAQLTRHRIASYSVKSQRYTDESYFNYVMPETVASDYETIDVFVNVIDAIQEAYQALIKAGIPKEDARYILPNACKTQLVMTMNARELLHFFRLRCCKRAQWEIRELANKMLELCREVAPVLFEKAGAPCEIGEGCPEEKPCEEGKNADG